MCIQEQKALMNKLRITNGVDILNVHSNKANVFISKLKENIFTNFKSLKIKKIGKKYIVKENGKKGEEVSWINLSMKLAYLFAV